MIVPLLLALLQGAGAAPPPAPDAGPLAVQLGLAVQPETVTVGQPFRVLVRIRAPRGATIDFPDGPDSSAVIEARDPREVRFGTATDAAEQTASYRLVAWDIETQPIPFGDVVVRLDGAERRVPLGGLQVYVRSVLPADTALRVPKPARGLLEAPPPWWRWWLVGLVALLLLALLLWWWRRRRRRPAVVLAVDAYALAEQEFRRVEALGLLDAGERGRFVALMVDVLRAYLAQRVPAAHPSLTSTELLQALRDAPSVPLDRLAAALAEADLVKFARRAVSVEQARQLGQEVRRIVSDVEQAEQARLAAERAAAERAAAGAAARREAAA